jgi:hypothetical protein
MAVDIRFIIDDLDRGQPLNPEDFSVTINEDDSIGARVVSFNNDLIFGGDVYSYLFDKLKASGYCELVKVRVDYLCGQVWQKLVDGYFIVTESIFEYDKCQVKCKLYDETFSTKINNNKSIPFSMNIQTTKNGEAVVPPTKYVLRLFNPTDGLYDGAGVGVKVYDALKHLVSCMSDNLVDFESDYFTANPGNSDMDVLSNGRNIRTDVATEIVISFEELFAALRSKFNVGMGFEKQANGRPLLRIEPQGYFFQLTPAANLYDQSGIQMNFDTGRLYASVQFGNEPVLEQNESSSQNDPPQSLSFAQTPFRGFRNETFGFTGECNSQNSLNLETRRVIFDANTIEDIFRFDNTSHDIDNIIIQCRFTAGVTNRFEARTTDPYGIGQTVYNGRYTNANVSGNWIGGYPNSLFSFLDQQFNPSDTFIESRVSNDSQTWDVDFNTPILFSTFNGNYIEFNTEITDPNNYWTTEQYTVPFAGVYTITSELIYGFLEPFNAGLNRRARLRFAHFDANDNLINDSYGTLFGDSGSTDVVITGSAQFVCNQGDIIRVDAEVNYLQIVTAPTMTQRILDTEVIEGETRFSFVTVEGVPFQSPDLEPVDIDDVRAYLYKFNRPLTMAEISSITSNTSNPITFGRRNDPLSVIPGYIKSLNIASVLRKNAEITLKSNILLQ